MEEEDDNVSDSTVLLDDYQYNPDKIAAKRRKLTANYVARAPVTSENAAPDDVNTIIKQTDSANSSILGENNGAEYHQWRVDKYFNSIDDVQKANEDVYSEDLKIKKELLKQEACSNQTEDIKEQDLSNYIKGDSNEEDIAVIVIEDSDDDSVANEAKDSNDPNSQASSDVFPGSYFDKFSKASRIAKPSAINARRATINHIANNEAAWNSTNIQDNQPRLRILQPAAINARRATIDISELTENLRIETEINNRDNNQTDNLTENMTVNQTETGINKPPVLHETCNATNEVNIVIKDSQSNDETRLKHTDATNCDNLKSHNITDSFVVDKGVEGIITNPDLTSPRQNNNNAVTQITPHKHIEKSRKKDKGKGKKTQINSDENSSLNATNNEFSCNKVVDSAAQLTRGSVSDSSSKDTNPREEVVNIYVNVNEISRKRLSIDITPEDKTKRSRNSIDQSNNTENMKNTESNHTLENEDMETNDGQIFDAPHENESNDKANDQSVTNAEGNNKESSMYGKIERVIKFQVGFCTLLKGNLQEYCQHPIHSKDSEKVKAYLKSVESLTNEIESLKALASDRRVKADIQYTCPICTRVSTYSASLLYSNVETHRNVVTNGEKCNFCRKIGSLYNSYMNKYLQKGNNKMNNGTKVESNINNVEIPQKNDQIPRTSSNIYDEANNGDASKPIKPVEKNPDRESRKHSEESNYIVQCVSEVDTLDTCIEKDTLDNNWTDNNFNLKGVTPSETIVESNKLLESRGNIHSNQGNISASAEKNTSVEIREVVSPKERAGLNVSKGNIEDSNLADCSRNSGIGIVSRIDGPDHVNNSKVANNVQDTTEKEANNTIEGNLCEVILPSIVSTTINNDNEDHEVEMADNVDSETAHRHNEEANTFQCTTNVDTPTDVTTDEVPNVLRNTSNNSQRNASRCTESLVSGDGYVVSKFFCKVNNDTTKIASSDLKQNRKREINDHELKMVFKRVRPNVAAENTDDKETSSNKDDVSGQNSSSNPVDGNESNTSTTKKTSPKHNDANGQSSIGDGKSNSENIGDNFKPYDNPKGKKSSKKRELARESSRIETTETQTAEQNISDSSNKSSDNIGQTVEDNEKSSSSNDKARENFDIIKTNKSNEVSKLNDTEHDTDMEDQSVGVADKMSDVDAINRQERGINNKREPINKVHKEVGSSKQHEKSKTSKEINVSDNRRQDANDKARRINETNHEDGGDSETADTDVEGDANSTDESDTSGDESNDTIRKTLEETFEKIKRNLNMTASPASHAANSNTKPHKILKKEVADQFKPDIKCQTQYECNICTCVFIYGGHFLHHMIENHNMDLKKIPKQCVIRKCSFCKVFLKENAINLHVKKYHPDEYLKDGDVVKCEKEPHVAEQDNEVKIGRENELIKKDGKWRYICLICNVTINSDYSARKHRKDKHPDMTNRRLYDKISVEETNKSNNDEANKANRSDCGKKNTKKDAGEIFRDSEHDSNVSCSENGSSEYETDEETDKEHEEGSNRGENSENENIKTKTPKVKHYFECTLCELTLNSLYAVHKHRKENHPGLKYKRFIDKKGISKYRKQSIEKTGEHFKYYNEQTTRDEDGSDLNSCSGTDRTDENNSGSEYDGNEISDEERNVIVKSGQRSGDDVDENSESESEATKNDSSDSNNEENDEQDKLKSKVVEKNNAVKDGHKNGLIKKYEKWRYICLICNVTINSYYSARKHRKDKHPDTKHRRLYDKISVDEIESDDDESYKTNRSDCNPKNTKNVFDEIFRDSEHDSNETCSENESSEYNTDEETDKEHEEASKRGDNCENENMITKTPKVKHYLECTLCELTLNSLYAVHKHRKENHPGLKYKRFIDKKGISEYGKPSIEKTGKHFKYYNEQTTRDEDGSDLNSCSGTDRTDENNSDSEYDGNEISDEERNVIVESGQCSEDDVDENSESEPEASKNDSSDSNNEENDEQDKLKSKVVEKNNAVKDGRKNGLIKKGEKWRYICLICNVTINSYYSARKHRKDKHPDTKHRRLYDKISVDEIESDDDESYKTNRSDCNPKNTKNVSDEIFRDSEHDSNETCSENGSSEYETDEETDKEHEEPSKRGDNCENENMITKTPKVKHYFECTLCELTLNSLYAVHKHRKENHPGLKYKRFIDKKGISEYGKPGIEKTGKHFKYDNEQTTRDEDGSDLNSCSGTDRTDDNNSNSEYDGNEISDEERNVIFESGQRSGDDVDENSESEPEASKNDSSDSNNEENDEQDKLKSKVVEKNNAVKDGRENELIKKYGKWRYICLICNVTINSDYSARKHRKDKHPDMTNRRLYDKISVDEINKSNNDKANKANRGDCGPKNAKKNAGHDSNESCSEYESSEHETDEETDRDHGEDSKREDHCEEDKDESSGVDSDADCDKSSGSESSPPPNNENDQENTQKSDELSGEEEEEKRRSDEDMEYDTNNSEAASSDESGKSNIKKKVGSFNCEKEQTTRDEDGSDIDSCRGTDHTDEDDSDSEYDVNEISDEEINVIVESGQRSEKDENSDSEPEASKNDDSNDANNQENDRSDNHTRDKSKENFTAGPPSDHETFIEDQTRLNKSIDKNIDQDKNTMNSIENKKNPSAHNASKCLLCNQYFQSAHYMKIHREREHPLMNNVKIFEKVVKSCAREENSRKNVACRFEEANNATDKESQNNITEISIKHKLTNARDDSGSKDSRKNVVTDETVNENSKEHAYGRMNQNSTDNKNADKSTCKKDSSTSGGREKGFQKNEKVNKHDQEHIERSSDFRKTTFSNCHVCAINFDVNEQSDHRCTIREENYVLYNCYACGVNFVNNMEHLCSKKHETWIDTIKISNVVTIKNSYVFSCIECKYSTDIYDDVVKHCQNHYLEIVDAATYCGICQLNFDVHRYSTHHDLHAKFEVVRYSYTSLFRDWDAIFDNIPRDVATELKVQSIYTAHSVRMLTVEDGPNEYSLYQCDQCKSIVPKQEVEKHCLSRCSKMSYVCSVCDRAFLSYEMRVNHEVTHRNGAKIFRIIAFNRIEDRKDNLKLIESRELQKKDMKPKTPTAELFQCQCDLSFVSMANFKMHFLECDSTSRNGIFCPKCPVKRIFLADELDRHLRLHHGEIVYEFVLNQINIRRSIEPNEVKCEVKTTDRNEAASTELDADEMELKRELLKQEDTIVISDDDD